MKNLELRSALIKSGAVLALCIFFIYAFAVGDSGGVGGTIGSLLSGLTFLIGISIAIGISVIILFGIYFGILYLYNPEISKKTFNEFKISCVKATANFPIYSSCCPSKKTAAPTPAVSLDDLQVITENQAKLGSQVVLITTTMETLQKSFSNFNATLNSAKDGIATLEEQTTSFEEAMDTKATTATMNESSAKMTTELQNLKNSIQPIATKLTSLEENVMALGSRDDKDGEDVQSLINTAVKALKMEIKAVQSEVAKLNTASTKDSKTEESDDEDVSAHRILSYFSKTTDANTFISSVTKAVGQGMTYAQISEFLDDTLSIGASEIITDHPSLTKDYIRTIRQKE